MEEELEALASSSRRKKETSEETFQRLYPWYMSIGMTYDEYWNQEALLVKFYREAYQQSSKQRNYELWLQGYYVHYAVSIALANGFRGKGKTPQPYLEKPFALNSLERKEEKEAEERKKMAQLMNYVQGNLKQYKK